MNTEIVQFHKLKLMQVLCIHKIYYVYHGCWFCSHFHFYCLLGIQLITDKTHPIEKDLGVRGRERFLWGIPRMTEGSCFVFIFSSANSIQEKKKKKILRDEVKVVNSFWGFSWDRRLDDHSQHRIFPITLVLDYYHLLCLGWKRTSSSKRCGCLTYSQRNICGKK